MAGQTASVRQRRLVKLWWRAAPSAVAALALIGGTADDCAAQSGRKWFGSKPAPVKQSAPPQNGFAATIERLLDEARRQAAAGQIEESIKTARRARKIAEASSAVLRDDPSVTVAAADELLRELHILQGELPSLNPVAAAPSMSRPTVRASTPSRTTTAYHEADAESAATANHVALPNPPVQPSAARPVPVEVRPHSVAVSQAVIPNPKPAVSFPAEAPLREQAPPTRLLAAARTYPAATPVGSEILASSRASSGGYLASGGFTILGGNMAPAAESVPQPEPVDEPAPTLDVVLGQPVLLLPAPVSVAEDVREPEAVVSAPIAVREFRPEPQLEELLPPVTTVDSEPPIEVVFREATSLPAAPIAPAVPEPVDVAEALDLIESTGNSSATLSVNRPVTVTVSEPAEEFLTSAAPVIAESATVPQPSIPVGSEPVLKNVNEDSTAWTSTDPTRRGPVQSQTAELDTAWESASGRKAESTPTPTTGPSASVPKVTPNAIATPVILSPIVTEPEAEQVTQIGFAPASQAVAEVSATAPAARSVAPPPPREIDDAPAASAPALSFDDSEDVQGPAAWVREQTATSTAPQPQWSASLIDQLARQWKLPAQTISAGLAAAGLALLGLGLTLVRFATRRDQ